MKARPVFGFLPVAFRTNHSVGLHVFSFRGSITRPTFSLCTLRTAGCPTLRNTRCRVVRPHLPGRDLHPLGFVAEFRVTDYILDLPSARACPGAQLVESEFTLRWLALDLRTLWWLTNATEDDQLCESIVAMICASPSIGDNQSVKAEAKRRFDEIDQELIKLDLGQDFEDYSARFRDAGQQRSREYEHVLARRFRHPFSRGLAALSSVRPDVTLAEYEPCAVTSAPSPDPEAIAAAIRRECHVIEFTAHLQQDLRNLDEYLRQKVHVYATLLESV